MSICVTSSQAYTMLNIHDLRTQLSCGQVSSCFLSCEGISYTSLTRWLFWQLCLWKLCTQVGVHITGSVPHATNHRVLYSRDAQDGYIPCWSMLVFFKEWDGIKSQGGRTRSYIFRFRDPIDFASMTCFAGSWRQKSNPGHRPVSSHWLVE